MSKFLIIQGELSTIFAQLVSSAFDSRFSSVASIVENESRSYEECEKIFEVAQFSVTTE